MTIFLILMASVNPYFPEDPSVRCRCIADDEAIVPNLEDAELTVVVSSHRL